MEAVNRPPLVISTRDARRLEALLQSPTTIASETASMLEGEITRARLVEPRDMPPDIVTMNSRVVCMDTDSGVSHEIELAYPHEADSELGRVSVLAPVGAALLGLAVGSSIDWPLPGGRMTRVRVVAVPHQPDVDGDTV